MDVTLACDIMTDLEGAIRPAIQLANALIMKGHQVSIISPLISKSVEHYLTSKGINPINLHVTLLGKNSGLSMLWFETWMREAFFGFNSKFFNKNNKITINFAHTLVLPCIFWYLQGPTSSALRDMEKELTWKYRWIYRIIKPLIEYFDGKLVKASKNNMSFAIANSKFCGTLYREWGIEPDKVIYPPIDCTRFKPSTSTPSADYVLTYFGKETAFSTIRWVADQGIKVRAFGSKAPYIPKRVIAHPNIKFLGKISTDELVHNYSNALATFFPFTHEPFGYIPVESMACGTPVLSYNRQGPGESIRHGNTGWLTDNEEDLVNTTVKIWKGGYDPQMRRACRTASLAFDTTLYVQQWLKQLEIYLKS